jgi:DNA mismatch repair protein MutS2
VKERTLQALEFDKIIRKLSDHASSSFGREKIQQLQPTSDIEQARHWQMETFEGYTMIRIKGNVPMGGIRDIRKAVHRSALGGILNTKELLEVASTISGGWRLRRFIEEFNEDQQIPQLMLLAERVERLQEVEDAIESAINEHGEVADHASAELASLRSQMRGQERRIKEKLEHILRSTSYQKMLQETIVTVRGDRYVIPVKQEYRQVFGGMIHDQSASGATLFIEPEAVMQLGNQLREIRFKEEREIEKILTGLTGKVADVASSLRENVESLAMIDFIIARASLAHEQKATQPRLNNKGTIRIKKARHPLIPMAEVVPIDIELGSLHTSLIITGPNTGGKTVTLKTLGLHALMAASGLHIPAEEEGEVAVFSGVFVDIGDEQSIEQNLSTFSAHLTNIIQILHDMDEHSLILLDELGAGTDPTEGAALAMAILDEMIQRKARIMATTHYSELKAFAYNRDHVLNASVEFDVETLRPTYRLLLGVPGRSNAFAIASRLGLPDRLIEAAKGHVDIEDSKVEQLIASLEENRLLAEQERERAQLLRREAEVLREDYLSRQEQFMKERTQLYKKAEEEAALAVAKARQEAEDIITELRRIAREEKTGIKEHKFIEAKKRLEESVPFFGREQGNGKRAGTAEKLKVGDEVRILSLGQKGEVLAALDHDHYQVQIGILKMNIKAEDLVLEKNKKKEQQPFTRVKWTRDSVRPELDLRGFNIEDAIMEIDKYLDGAVMTGLNQVSLIHGKGTGVLRVGVQNYLKKHRNVRSFRLGGQGEGGLGVTIVELK